MPERIPAWEVPAPFEVADTVSVCESGSRNRVKGASVFVPPLNSPAKLDTSPPSPPIALNAPPPNALEIPPEAVCFNKLVHSLPPCELAILLLDGEPKLMPFAVPVSLNGSDRTSGDVPGLKDLGDGPEVAKLEDFVGESKRERLTPSAVTPANRPNKFAKSLLVFTLVLHNPLLFEKLDRFYTSCIQGHRETFT
jgi:hypothetical protein